jgi:hypothetical protein
VGVTSIANLDDWIENAGDEEAVEELSGGGVIIINTCILEITYFKISPYP